MITKLTAITPEYMKHRIEEETEQYKQEIERLNNDRNKLYENGLNVFLELQKKRVENERLNNIINELEKELNKDFNTYMTGNIQKGKIYKAGANNYKMHIYLKLQELKGSDKE